MMSDNLGVIIGVLVLFIVLGTGWWLVTLILPLARGYDKAPRWLLFGLQLNIVLIYFAWLVRPYGIFWGVIAPWYPALAFATLGREGFFAITGVLTVPLLAGLVAAVAVMAVGLMLKPLRLIAPGIALLVGLTVIALQAPGYAAATIEQSARALNASCLAQTSLWESRKFAGKIPQYHLHAVARINGTWHGWSYAAGDFYEIPPSVALSNLKLINACQPLVD